LVQDPSPITTRSTTIEPSSAGGERTKGNTVVRDTDIPADIPSWDVDPATPLWRIRPVALLFLTRVLSNVTNHMITVAVGYQVYDLTESATLLGLIGLAQFMPPLMLMLFAGQASDRFNRRQILRVCYAVSLCAVAGFVVLSLTPQPSVVVMFALVLMQATARTFELPAIAALMPLMAPRAVLGRAIAAYVSAGKVSMLVGPSLGGVLYLFGPYVVYGTCVLTILTAAVACFLLPRPPDPTGRPRISFDTLLAGFRFMGRNDTLLGVMSLDLVATLLGGVQALLPIYARDILDIGAFGAGVLRSAPAVGALVAAAVLVRVPITRYAGVLMYVGVVVYGVSAIVFGLSQNAIISIAALIVLGAGDMVSAVVRQTLVQVTTPDEMRGRVSAVNSLFNSTSDQLGWFRAGMMAAWFGPVASVAIGGVAAIVTVAVWNWRFPTLRHVERPDEAQP
jgi:MFS family permease